MKKLKKKYSELWVNVRFSYESYGDEKIEEIQHNGGGCFDRMRRFIDEMEEELLESEVKGKKATGAAHIHSNGSLLITLPDAPGGTIDGPCIEFKKGYVMPEVTKIGVARDGTLLVTGLEKR